MTQLRTSTPPSPERWKQFGPLRLAFTDQFNWMWSSEGSSADDVSFWQPIPPEGFFILGGLIYPSFDDPNGKAWALCVQADESDRGALAFPSSFSWIWDSVGSHCDAEGSCWLPEPPNGYSRLGEIMTQNHDAPSGAGAYNIVCVRNDLVREGATGNRIWTDAGTGASHDMSAWEVIPGPDAADTGKVLLAANTFIGHSNYERPTWNLGVLHLPIPVTRQPAPAIPTLNSRIRPDPSTAPQCERIVTVPFTAISDPARDLHRQVMDTPFYDVERWSSYTLLLFDDNGTSSPQHTEMSVASGITEELSKTFSITTGLEIGYETGIDLVAKSKASVKLTLQFGYSTTSSVSEFRSETVTAHLDTPAGKAGALWGATDTFRIKRRDGSYVSSELQFEDSDSYVHAEFPHADDMPKGRKFVSFPAAK